MVETRKKYYLLLLPFAFLYRIGVAFRNFLFTFKILPQKEFDLPVICVGNITVGGTGKTPHVDYIVNSLKNTYKLAVLSRGYKRKTKQFTLGNTESTVNEIGDEPLQILLNNPEITVAVDRNRVNGIEKLISIADPDAIILDDAYQHRYVKAGTNILLIDYNRPITKDHFLPAGDLREAVSEKSRADIILVTKTPEDLKPIERRIMEKELDLFPYQNLFFTSINYKKIKHLFDESVLEINKETTVLLVTGIADPQHLKEHIINKYTDKLEEIIFPDHHNFTDSDLDNILNKFNSIKSSNKIIVTTEKDKMRLTNIKNLDLIKNLPIYYQSIGVKFVNEKNEKLFNNIIEHYVRTNQRNNQIYQETY